MKKIFSKMYPTLKFVIQFDYRLQTTNINVMMSMIYS